MKFSHSLLFGLPLAASLAVPAVAQTQQAQPQPNSQTSPSAKTSGTSMSTSQNAALPQDDKLQPADAQTHQPLQIESHEGFWGHLNPFARKKYVRRQMAPIAGRVNELDELTASNSKQIKDVDSRAAEGIRLASLRANEADNHALEAGRRADQARQTADQANTHLQSVEKVVTNLDQYQPVSDTEIRFRPGQNVLSQKAKAALDDLAVPLKQQRGYVVEVQGFSSGRGQAALQNSQRMADAVVRYLVINHEVPVYRIFTVGMGNAPTKVAADGTKAKRITGGRVEIGLLRNGLADMQTAQAGTVQRGSDLPNNDQQMPSQQNQAPAVQPAPDKPKR